MARVKTIRPVIPIFKGRAIRPQPQDDNDEDTCQQSKDATHRTRRVTAAPLTAVAQLPRTCHCCRNSRARKLNALQLFRCGLPVQGHVNQSLDDVTQDQPPLTIQYKVCSLEKSKTMNYIIRSIRITFGWCTLHI